MSHGLEKSTKEEPQIDSLKMLAEDMEHHPEYLTKEYLGKWLENCDDGLRKIIAGIIREDGDSINMADPATRALIYYISSLQKKDLENAFVEFKKLSRPERKARFAGKNLRLDLGDPAILDEFITKFGDGQGAMVEIFGETYRERFEKTAEGVEPPCQFPEPAATFGLITAYRSDETSRASPPPEDKTGKVAEAMIAMFAVADHYGIPLGTLLAANRAKLTDNPQILRSKNPGGTYVIDTHTLYAEMHAIDAAVKKAAKKAEKKITARPVNPALVLYYLIRKEHELAEDSDELHEAAAKDLSKYLVEMFAFNEKPIAPHVAHSGAKEKTIEFARRATLENARPTFNGTLGKIPFLKGLSSNSDHRAIEHCFNLPVEAEEEKKPAVIKTQDIVALSVYLRKQATDARTKGKISGIRVHDLHDVEHFVKTLEGIIAARLAGKIADIKEDEIPAQLPAVVRREFVRPLSVAKEKDLHDLEKELIAVKPLEHGHGHGDAPFFEKAGRATAVAAIIAQIGEMIKWAMDWLNVDGNKGGGAKKDDHGHSGGHP